VAPTLSRYRPLLARRVRGLAIAVIVLATMVISVLGTRYADQDMPGHLDRVLDALIGHRLHQQGYLTRALSNLGNPDQVALLVAIVAVAAAAARRWSGVLLTVVGTIAAAGITELVLKPLIGRLRFGHLTFPSGHTTGVAAVTIAAAILIGGAGWPRSLAVRVLASLAVAAIAIGVAVSLVAQDIHYSTDTVGGYCVALATVLAVALFLDYCGPRLRTQRSAPSDQNEPA
jgi:membrane-associated phospholipid phosphatase